MKERTSRHTYAGRDGLTQMELDFCYYHVQKANLGEAVRLAGYKNKNLADKARKLLATPLIQQEVARLKAEMFKQNTMKVVEAMSILADMIRVDPLDLFDGEGNLRHLKDVPKATRLCIDDISFKTVYETTKKGKVAKVVPSKVKLSNKQQAIDKVLRHLGAYERDNQTKNTPVTLLSVNPISEGVQNLIQDVKANNGPSEDIES